MKTKKKKTNDPIEEFFLSNADSWLREATILLTGKRSRIPALLNLVCTHEDCPEWLKGGIWDVINDNTDEYADYSQHWFEKRMYKDGEIDREGNRERARKRLEAETIEG